MTRRPPAWVLALLLAGSPLPARAGDGDGKGKEAKKEKPAAPEPYRAGDEVKDLALDLVAGGKWTAEGARKKVTLLVFAGAAGGWSKESLDALKRLPAVAKRYAGKGVEVLAVLRDATVEKAKEAAAAEKLDATLAVDPKRAAYDRFAKRGLPYAVVLDREVKVAYTAAGWDEEAVQAKIDALTKPR